MGFCRYNFGRDASRILVSPHEGENKRPPLRKPRQVTDIFTWIQYSMYVSVRPSRLPESVPELMAYQIMISRTIQDFVGFHWVQYDEGFRKQATITSNRMRSKIKPTLYSLCFTGRTQAVSRCELCFSTGHSSQQCSLSWDQDPELPTRLKAVGTAVLSLASGRTHRTANQEVCRNWNDNRCRVSKCKHRHTCSRCGSSEHPAASCTKLEGLHRQWQQQTEHRLAEKQPTHITRERRLELVSYTYYLVS